MRISVIMPVLDEAQGVSCALQALAPLRALGHEVIVVDGGSADDSAALARPLADQVLRAPRGRASQMNAGAAVAAGDALLFLHADTRLPTDAAAAIRAALAGGACWGRFDVRIDSPSPLLAVVARFMNWRSRLSGIATGDQAMFVRREVFSGFPAIALMEDIALSRLLKRAGRPACLRTTVLTSARRWEHHGILRTILLMWRLRLAYFLGAHPEDLGRRYAEKA